MIYRPLPPWIMWDSWLFEWQATFLLFYIERQEETGKEGVTS